MALLNYQAGLNNNVVLNSPEYRFAAFGDRIVFAFKPVGFSLNDVLTANTPYFYAGHGAISRFAAVNPVFQIGSLDAGLGFDWLVNDKIRFQAAYGTGNSFSANLFGSDRSNLGVQLLLKPNANLVTGLAYINAYSRDGRLNTFTGSFNADTSGNFLEPSQIHALSGTLQWRFASNSTFGAWGGIIYTDSISSNAFAVSATSLLSLNISDPFGRKGDLLAFLVGVPPKLIVGGQIERFDSGTSFHFETFYRFTVNDKLFISPGFFIVTNPGHICENNNIFIGNIRATFLFLKGEFTMLSSNKIIKYHWLQKFLFFMGSLCLCLSIGLHGFYSVAEEITSARIIEILDSDQVFIENKKARKNDIAQLGQQVRTEAARAGLRFNTGATTRLDTNTSVIINSECIKLEGGRIVISKTNACIRQLRVVPRGTIYMLEVNETGKGNIKDLEGQIEIFDLNNPSVKPVVLSQGQQIDISPSGQLGLIEQLSPATRQQILTGSLFQGFKEPLTGIEKIPNMSQTEVISLTHFQMSEP